MGETTFPERGDEDEERGRVEQPEGGRPTDGTHEQPGLGEELAEALGHAVRLHGELVAVEKRHVGRPTTDDVDRPVAPTRERQREPGDQAHEHDAGPGRDGVQRVVPVQEHRHQEGQPQDRIEHQGRSDALHAEREPGVGPGHA